MRALDVLKAADSVICEDTRVTQKLLSAYGIKNKLIVYNDQSTDKNRQTIISHLKQGKVIALVSDAGTPLISDPGYKLVRECRENNLPVYPIPGASALIAALSVSGVPTDHFFFEGFLPSKQGAKTERLEELKNVDYTVVIYESGHRLIKTLEDMLEVMGDGREIVIARELTKMFEEVKKLPLEEHIKFYQDNGAPKGEIVILLEQEQKQEVEVKQIDEEIIRLLDNNGINETSKIISRSFGVPKKIVYERALQLKDAKKE